MKKSEKKWQILHKLPVSSINSLVGVLLENRGIKNVREKKEFFAPTPPEKLDLKSLDISSSEVNKAIKRLRKAKKDKEKVIVYGDYDADGICATAIVWETLYALGLDVMPYIPERFSEGYGLNTESLEKLKTLNPKLKLIITVDHGIVADKKVDFAKELGIDVIITDHHLPRINAPDERKRSSRRQVSSVRGEPVIPQAYSVVHTMQIGGAAVAWILTREILKKVRPMLRSDLIEGLELVAIGTIADQLPLLGPNRSFVKYGLEALNRTKRPGLLALYQESGLGTRDQGPTLRKVGPYEVGFLIAPRLNAMGRLEHAMESLRLLCTKNKTRAAGLASHLGKTNLERQKIVDEVVVQALRQASLDKARDKQKIIVLAHESYHEGVIGLAAGKLVEEFYRPAIVFSKKGEISKASARSISGFNIIEAIRSLESLYIEGGGHPMAAGFSIKTELIAEFTKRINEFAKPLLTEEILSRKLRIDLEIDFNQINQELLERIQDFEPTGLGNPSPTFATKGVELVDARVVGKDGSHLKLKLKQDSSVFDGIAFGQGALFAKLSSGKKTDVAYQIEEDTWNGNKKLQLKIKDIIVQ